MKVLVTGCKGFIGSHLMEALRFHPQVKSLLGVSRSVSVGDMMQNRDLYRSDVSDRQQVRALFREFSPDVIFHLAANPLSTPTDESIYKSNVLPTHYLLKECNEGTRFILASSATVYGNLAKDSGIGIACYETDVTRPTSLYGVSKLASEGILNAFAKSKGIRGTSLRLVATVGKGATHGLLPDLVRKLKSDNPVLELIGEPPGTVKPFIHVTDVVRAFVKTLEQDIRGSFNVSTWGDPISVEKVAEAVMTTIDIHKPMKFTSKTWPGDNELVNINAYRFSSSFNWVPIRRFSESAVRQAARELCQQF